MRFHGSWAFFFLCFFLGWVRSLQILRGKCTICGRRCAGSWRDGLKNRVFRSIWGACRPLVSPCSVSLPCRHAPI
uniref:Putative secreted protein n=1 Tax=Ixodes ricinus TaxID=34613 RepID=A0A6B0TV58_IXORI